MIDKNEKNLTQDISEIDYMAIELVVYKWGNALICNNIEMLNDLLTEELRQDNNYIKQSKIFSYIPPKYIDMSFAKFIYNKKNPCFSPILVYSKSNLFPSPYSISFCESSGGKWMISAINISKLPDGMGAINSKNHKPTVPIRFSLQDQETCEPTYARVRITNAVGEYWPPRWHKRIVSDTFNEDIGGDVIVAGETYAYVTPEFTADLLEGSYKIEVLKGMEYIPSCHSFEVTINDLKAPPIVIPMNRWINMQKINWYSGDNHVNFLSTNNALLEMQAEDINIINITSVRGQLDQFTGEPDKISIQKHIVTCSQELQHDHLGHTVLNMIKTPVYPDCWGDGFWSGTPGGLDYPTMAHLADSVHEQGGMISWAHLPVPNLELPIDVALNKIDALEVINLGDPYTPVDFDASKPDQKPYGGSAIDWWYRFLNTGFRLPATAGSDKMTNCHLTGSSRVYANINKGEFTYEEWVEAIKKGKTFVTTGPMISLNINGFEIGSVLNMNAGEHIIAQVKVCTLYEKYPVDKVELIKNGKVVAVVHNNTKNSIINLSAEVKLTKSSWLAARAYGGKILPYYNWISWAPMPVTGHTSPIYINIDNRRIWSEVDAAVLIEHCNLAIDWAKNKARFYSEEQRKEVITLFEKGKSVYCSLQNLYE